MIRIKLAGVPVGIDNQYEIAPRLEGWLTDETPAFTVRVAPEELAAEDEGRGFPPDYLEYICVYRHIAERLPDWDAFVFHGVAMGLEGLAYLFTAPSGTGKTFHGRLWYHNLDGKAWFLNGDKPILRRTETGFRVYGTPWRGKENYGVNADLPAQGICILRRGPEIAISPTPPEELVRFLSRQIYFPHDPERAAKLLDLLDALCTTVPAWTLICAKNARCARLSYETMRPKRKE